MIQKHAATRLHYDLRLELDGVMKSWAVTRGPSLVPGEKRLAVQVEDHPVEYNDFEGTIPKGEYGGGTVLIWDRGRWMPEYDPHKGLAKGHLDFTLEGKKLHGRWHLVRMRSRPRREARQLAADQVRRRGGARPERSGHSGGEAEIGGERPHASRRSPRPKATRCGSRTKSVAENVKQIKKATKTAKKAAPKKKAAKKARRRPSRSRAPHLAAAEVLREQAGASAAPCPPSFRRSLRRLHDTAPDGAQLGPRGEVRRLPHAGAARPTARSSC